MRARLFSDQQPPRPAFGKRLAPPPKATAVEPTATEAAAYVGTIVAEYAAYALLALCALMAWVGSPA